MAVNTQEIECETFTVAASGIKAELYNWIIKTAKAKDLTKSQFVRRILADAKAKEEISQNDEGAQ